MKMINFLFNLMLLATLHTNVVAYAINKRFLNKPISSIAIPATKKWLPTLPKKKTLPHQYDSKKSWFENLSWYEKLSLLWENPIYIHWKIKKTQQEIKNYLKHQEPTPSTTDKDANFSNITLTDVQQAIRESMHNQLEQAAFEKALKDAMQQNAATT